MKYLCLVYHEATDGDLPPEIEHSSMTSAVLDERDALPPSDGTMTPSPLHSVQGATTIKVQNGRMSITDGSSVEMMEQLEAFSVIDARDLNDALRVASKLTPARRGSIEVRAIGEAPSD